MANTQPQIAVKQLTIVGKTATSISIRWNKATDKETPQDKLLYTVTWCVAPYRWDNNIRKIGERKFDNSSYTITGLQPNTTYEIIVYVRDADGYENTYARTTVTTMPSTVPDTAPTIPNRTVVIAKINANTLDVSWQKATDRETAQRDLKYLVTWTPGPDYAVSNRKQSVYMTDATSYRISGLFPNTSYQVRVFVYDGKNFSSYNPSYVTTANAAGTNQTGNTGTSKTPVDINSLLASVSYTPKDLVNDDLYNDKTIYPDAFESLPDREAAYILTKTETDINNEEIYVRGSGYENIYPGAILLINPDLTTGNPTPLSGVRRTPVTIYGDFLAGSTTTQPNVNPNNDDIREATNRIMRKLLADPSYEAPGMQAPRTRIHTSEKSLMLDLKVDASFGGVKVNVHANTDSKKQSFIQATTLEQDYFTVKMKDTWRQDPSSLFDKSVTVEQLRKAMNGKALAIVTSVTYGRTFSYLREYSASKYTFDSSEKVTAYGQSVDGSQKGSEEVTSTNESLFNLGGTALSISALKSKKTQEDLEKAMADNMKFSANNQGVVTKYTIQLLSGTTPGKVIRPTFTGKQYQIGYARCPRKLSMYVDVSNVTIGGPGGGDVRVHLDVECFRVTPQPNLKEGEGVPTIFKVVNGRSSDKVQDPWWYTFNNSRTREFGDLKPGEYIKYDPLLRVRSRYSKVADFKSKDEKRLNHGEITSGEMTVTLEGRVTSSIKITKINDK